MEEYLALLMFAALVPLLFTGFPVAFVLGGVGLAFWGIAVAMGLENGQSFFLVVARIFGGVVDKPLLVAVPMFIFMGQMLEKSGVARDLLSMLQRLTRRVPGGLALSVTLLGTILAATTGIIGASVVMMTLLALPVMLEHGYNRPLATGTIAASGTLGILLPPSIMLVVMADLLSISAGGLFMAAVGPGLLLATLYALYILVRTWLNPSLAPSLWDGEAAPITFAEVVRSLLPPLGLMLAVLGAIFAGFATPTEASGIGAFGALLLALFKGRLSFPTLREVVEETALTSAMLFGLFVGATAFSYVFALLEGHHLILSALEATGAGPWHLIVVLMLAVFFLGFFFDWIEITLIILPVFAPVIAGLDFGTHVPVGLVSIWFAILMAVNLQTSFLTPPFGFALFYLKGAAPADVALTDIYRGILPFVLLQILGLAAIILWPEIALWLVPAR
ncbi:TRAP transporter large permease [Gimibacter soli]|uniref:TRAP transporter large permease protein n=1 Tax=Gimibacter soli TaxID=3024400 RepID=A0AAF0BL63_9PROT|nr:TRAP transporter large permease subunit [Gimibacter soli]WCL53085.1 TRAP transporter large permease subunit [Gimibacter soli]